MEAKIYYYNDVDHMLPFDKKDTKIRAKKALESVLSTIKDYDKWKMSVKAFNKFITVKFKKLDYSRYAHKKEINRIINKLQELTETNDMHKYVQIAYPDAFYHDNIHYYPVDFPQKFKLKSDNILTKVLHSKEEAIKYFENWENNDILDVDTSELISYKVVSEDISEFFTRYKDGVIYITNEINSGK
jgi:hypothetical protein